MDRLKLWCGLAASLALAMAIPANLEARGYEHDTLRFHSAAKKIGFADLFNSFLTVECLGEEAYPISGGFEAPDLESHERLRIGLSRDITSQVPPSRGWGVGYAYGVDFSETTDLTMRVVCAEERPKYVQNTRSTLASGERGGVSVQCPPGRHVYGGGGGVLSRFSSSSMPASYPIDSNDRDKKPDDGWKITVSNWDNHDVSLVVRAVCGQTMPSYVESTLDVTPGGYTDVNVPCEFPPSPLVAIGGGHKVVGGGFDWGNLKASMVIAPPDFTVYHAAMFNRTEDELSLTAYEICGDPSDFG